MTKDEIIRMAREASNTPIDHHATPDLFGINQIERFAALVASAEREECAKECDIQASFGNDDERFGARQCGYVIRARGQA